MGNAVTDSVKAYRKLRLATDPVWAKERRAKKRIQWRRWFGRAISDPTRSSRVMGDTRSRQSKSKRNIRARNRLIVITHYGGKCKCCSETVLPFLTMDHINGGGAAHKREVRSVGGCDLYTWLIRHNFPKGFRVLCWNCNCGRYMNGGKCPHKGVGHHSR